LAYGLTPESLGTGVLGGDQGNCVCGAVATDPVRGDAVPFRRRQAIHGRRRNRAGARLFGAAHHRHGPASRAGLWACRLDLYFSVVSPNSLRTEEIPFPLSCVLCPLLVPPAPRAPPP